MSRLRQALLNRFARFRKKQLYLRNNLNSHFFPFGKSPYYFAPFSRKTFWAFRDYLSRGAVSAVGPAVTSGGLTSLDFSKYSCKIRIVLGCLWRRKGLLRRLKKKNTVHFPWKRRYYSKQQPQQLLLTKATNELFTQYTLFTSTYNRRFFSPSIRANEEFMRKTRFNVRAQLRRNVAGFFKPKKFYLELSDYKRKNHRRLAIRPKRPLSKAALFMDILQQSLGLYIPRNFLGRSFLIFHNLNVRIALYSLFALPSQLPESIFGVNNKSSRLLHVLLIPGDFFALSFQYWQMSKFFLLKRLTLISWAITYTDVYNRKVKILKRYRTALWERLVLNYRQTLVSPQLFYWHNFPYFEHRYDSFSGVVLRFPSVSESSTMFKFLAAPASLKARFN